MRGISTVVAITSVVATGTAQAAETWTPVERDPSVREVPFDDRLFKADPEFDTTYNPEAEIEIYGGKSPVDNPKPPIEIGRGLYDPGEIGEGIQIFGPKNRLFPQFSVFGDIRTAIAFNDNGDKEVGVIAARANLDFDLQLTGTERIHMLWQPIQGNGNFTRFEFAGNDESDGKIDTNKQPTNLFFEGDLGAIVSAIQDDYTSWDMPFAFGRVPLLFQNTYWFNDEFLGAAFTIPAQNSSALDITNYDITFFAGFDEVSSLAFQKNGKAQDHEAKMFGVAGFFDVAEGYLETGAALFIDTDDSDGDLSYLNLTAAFSKRYFGLVANATRFIVNVGQNPGKGIDETANGFILTSENAFITSSITLIPYANFFIAKDKVRNAAGDKLLKNVGLSFETDDLTLFPKLDDTGTDAMGGAIGVEYLFGLEQQVVGEIAFQTPWDNEEGITDPQMGFGVRYQRPLTNRVIFRADAMYGLLFGDDNGDFAGVRAELRVKL